MLDLADSGVRTSKVRRSVPSPEPLPIFVSQHLAIRARLPG